MKCLDCSFDGVVLENDRDLNVMVSCPNCNVKDSIEDYVVLTGVGFSYQVDGLRFRFLIDGDQVAEVRFSLLDDNFSIQMDSYRPSQAKRLIEHLKTTFGPAMNLMITQTDEDGKFNGCPVCQSQSLTKKSPLWAACGSHFEISLLHWAQSLAYGEAKMLIIDEKGATFVTVHYYWPEVRTFSALEQKNKVDLAKIEIRPEDDLTVVAVRPLAEGFEAEVDQLVSLLQAMKSPGLDVMKVNRRL